VPTRRTSLEWIPASRSADSNRGRTTAWTDSSLWRRTIDVCQTWCCKSTSASLCNSNTQITEPQQSYLDKILVLV